MGADKKGCITVMLLAVISWLCFWGFATLVRNLVEGATL